MRRSVAVLLGGWALIVVVSCTDQEPTRPGIRAAGGGGSSGVTVTAADPDSATQDTTLDVAVSGAGFDQGSEAQWAIAGVPSLMVHTNSTRFVSPKKLVANITIAIDADTGRYDVIVTASTGKKGIGSELFAIKTKATDTPIVATYRDAVGDGVLSDAQLRPGLDSAYVDGVDGVSALLLSDGNYRTAALNGSSTREFCFAFHGQSTGGLLPDAFCDHGYHTTGSPDLSGGLAALAPGASMTTSSQVTWVMNGYNWFLRFGKDCSLNDVPSKRATVTRSADGSTWTVTTPAVAGWLCNSPVKGKPGSGTVGEVAMPYQITVQLK
jgi:hypothetical protein